MNLALAKAMDRANWRTTTHDAASAPMDVPADYVSVIETLGAGEGFIGTEFVRLFPPRELAALNVSYEIAQYVPGLLLFGSNGGGEAYCFDLRDAAKPIVRVPFASLGWDYVEQVAKSLSEMLRTFSDLEGRAGVPNPQMYGMEIFEIHPIALGGDPRDPKNKVLLTREKHIEAVRFWNKVLAKVKAETLASRKTS